LTKNPAALMDDRYIQALHRLNCLPADHPRQDWFEEKGFSPLQLEISLAFFNDAHRRLLDPAAPSVESRMEAIRLLRQHGLPVFLRIDPLFPRDPLGGDKLMADFGLSDVQSMSDLEGLVSFGRDASVQGIIYSVAKITRPQQGGLAPVMEQMKRVYQHLSAEKPLVFHGGSWRLPENVATQLVVGPFLELCTRFSMPAKACKANLITTP
jgi:hypothetical protein